VKRTLWIIIFALLCGLRLSGQSAPISGFVVNQYGEPAANVPVYICSAAGSSGLPCSPVASIYYDYNLSNPAPNPISTDSNGNYNVYVPALAFPNVYVANAVTGYGTPTTQLYSGPYCSLSGCTFTGPITATLFNATTSPYFEVNGVQLASTNLLDTANIAYLNAANVFTGSPQTAPIFNAATQYNVAGVQILSNGTTGTGAIVLANTPTLVAPNIGVATGTSLALTGNETVGGTLGVTGNVTAPIFNAATGFEIAGAAPLNHILVGDGTNYVDSATIPAGSLPTLYYQTIETNGTAAIQRPTINFSFTNPAIVSVTDSASPARTNYAFNTTGDGQFFTTSTTSGPSGDCGQWDAAGNMGYASGPCSTGGGQDEYSSLSGCSWPNDGGGLTCAAGNITWPVAFSDSSYTAQCVINYSAAIAGGSSTQPAIILNWTISSASQMAITEGVGTGSSGGYLVSTNYGVTIYCHGHHN
jgi:hypothetical protein